ncbi:TetR/AcrR family transcriptional regulator [Frankia sp. AgPm24]|uniref:TetR/AcrR family transcriptional regulator n=1 Tax=Frankia umida TaxID=573489 RepID=A0ABT0K4K6_9ACTN|nr:MULTISPECIES: TetR/AcrR family transcriptional regulator [Frankia]MCK9878730.1 TetR/AcrR family transcriptional regulator [Frankia umida]MCK9922941.1 TetR/AcrR family transcriptional regulator [Frankia sp. AgPm24]
MQGRAERPAGAVADDQEGRVSRVAGSGGRVRWGSDTALVDDDEARRRLVAAAGRCLLARGAARLTVDEVAREAAVVRSTVYRYFGSRDELILAVLLERIDAAMRRVTEMLEHPDDASRSISDLIMHFNGLVPGNPFNEALFSPDSRWLVTSLEVQSELVVDTYHQHLRPLLTRWQATGQLRADLDLRETSRWLNTVGLLLLAPPWTQRSDAAKREFVEHYVVRALLAVSAARPPS